MKVLITISRAGITWEGVRVTQSSPCSAISTPQEPSYEAIGKKSLYHLFDAPLGNVSPSVIPLYNCNHFLYRTVEAVLDYAYTGKVELTVGSAERIYLLAHNLRCKRLMKTCVQFLIPRLVLHVGVRPLRA